MLCVHEWRSLWFCLRELIQIAQVYYADDSHEQDVKNDDPGVYVRLNEALTGLRAV